MAVTIVKKEPNGELVQDFGEAFFAPAQYDLIDTLLNDFNVEVGRIDRTLELLASNEFSVHWFVEGMQDRYRGVDFDRQAAMNAVTSAYWSKAMNLTDIWEYMPTDRRNQWSKQLSAWKDHGYKRGRNPDLDLPEFTQDNVRSTIQFLYQNREKFFAEKVDGIFKALSGEHVTNTPEGFNKRMIIAYVHDGMMSNSGRCSYITDLRAVIAKFMGRDAPTHWEGSRSVDDGMKRYGEWMTLDGGAIRLKVFQKGTAHLEVHPDMAWRLNCVLASLYPAAIPSKFRRKPEKPSKDFGEIKKPLPFAVLRYLYDLKKAHNGSPNDVYLHANAGAVRDMVMQVLESIGGVYQQGIVRFDYNPWPVIEYIRLSGLIPEDKSHQFYPTPEALAFRLVDWCDIEDGHLVLEPSAGTGALADHLPNKDNVACLELSDVRCKVLESKGYKAECVDFLSMTPGIVDRVVMNPPFSENRWKLHLSAAGKWLGFGGVLCAILPASAKGHDEILGSQWKCEWSDTIHDAFAGTGVSVVLLRAEKA